MSKKAFGTISKEIEPLILFGLDGKGKPRAARFPASQADLVTKAARTMALRLGVATTAAHFEVVRKLPVGRLYATGKSFVPNIRQDLYDQLNALTGGNLGLVAPSLPKSWHELGPGHLVLAQESAVDGWWEAVVLKRQDGMLLLKWRDYPRQAEFARHYKAVALFNSDEP